MWMHKISYGVSVRKGELCLKSCNGRDVYSPGDDIQLCGSTYTDKFRHSGDEAGARQSGGCGGSLYDGSADGLCRIDDTDRARLSNLWQFIRHALQSGGRIIKLCRYDFVKKIPNFSMVGVSVAGGLLHNMGQLIVAMAVVENIHLVSYLPPLMIAGTVTGMLIGIISGQVVPRIKHVLK